MLIKNQLIFQFFKVSRRIADNTFIGGFRLEGIPPAPVGQPKISVQFQMDNSDLLVVTATCSNLRSQQTLDVNLVSREDEAPQAAPQADIIFLIDTSGSMSDELEGVKRSCLDFAERVISSGVDCQLGLVDFDVPLFGSTYNWEVFGRWNPKNFLRQFLICKLADLVAVVALWEQLIQFL